jgi:hypothetical protein
VVGKRFIVLKGRNLKSSFLKLCEIHKRETLHWLKYKGEKRLWKETRGGDIYSLMNCIHAEIERVDKRIKSGSCEVNEDSIWDLSERTVLVVAEPGMGKSCVAVCFATVSLCVGVWGPNLSHCAVV